MRIAVMTSGGDAPGMNAAVRTIVVAGIARGHEVYGIRRGYEGLLEGEFVPVDVAEVDSISRMGGTFLGTGRSKRFPTEEGQHAAHEQLTHHQIDALVVIGGNGSLTGAHMLATRDPRPCQVLGLPASIDNDLGHCDLSIGADTATNTIVEACDRILDTARAHRRAFLVEVMGRSSGFLAMRAGIAAEADAILYGESQMTEDEAVEKLEQVLLKCFTRGRKTRSLILKAEGVKAPTDRLVERLQRFLDEKVPGVGIRATILGHVVRGGAPSAIDRSIAQRLGFASVMAAEAGVSDVMMSWKPPYEVGIPTVDPYVIMVPLDQMLAETSRLLDGTSPVVQKRMELLQKVEHLMSF